MINPNEVTNFNRTTAELEEFLLFCIVVAGKNSYRQSVKLEEFIDEIKREKGWECPFDNILARFSYNLERDIYQRLLSVSMGQYERITHAFIEVSKTLKNKLHTCTIEDLESVKGIGPKTARFFLLHTRYNQNIAVLDTHILKWLGSKGHKVPKSTPSGKKYKELEDIFLSYCKEYNMTPAELDLKIWKEKGLTKINN